MLSTSILDAAAIAAVAASSTTIAPASDACKVHLIAADFTPSKDTDLADLTAATFTGSTPKLAGTGAQQTGIDPLTGQRFVQLKEPAGGWSFTCTAAPVSQENIYGYVVTNNDSTETYGSHRFDTPIPVSQVGHTVTIDQVRLTAPTNLFV